MPGRRQKIKAVLPVQHSPVPPPPMGPASPPPSAAAREELLQALVLQASASAVSYRPPPVGTPSPPTRRTSGTQATPAPTLPPPLDRASSPSTNALTTSVS